MFRFTIRDLLWLTLVVAVGLSMGLAWWSDRSRLASEIAFLRDWMENMVVPLAPLPNSASPTQNPPGK
jgi:hypothetical protein